MEVVIVISVALHRFYPPFIVFATVNNNIQVHSSSVYRYIALLLLDAYDRVNRVFGDDIAPGVGPKEKAQARGRRCLMNAPQVWCSF